MAAAEAKSSDSLQDDLKCPVCLGLFTDAIMLPTCGHTFCRRCLREYLQSYRHLGHMVCPVCRKITKFTPAKGVDDFPANVTVNKIVDNYRQDHGCKTETRPKCTACRRQRDAESFCKTCDKYLCKRCLTSHQQMSVMFEGHEIVSIEETKGLKGKVSIGNSS
ncbi:tripartite motif-containing protein 59-like [Lytechinus variegatus]|uniref:tripartite motif-containing protein 59-like n=1 Tax=Lytechinus variegatus TaxID=7654 RepID=UPI001BB0F04F|nr:tripartite motif-containing protein 59-like [Lytechinus variegatus]